MSSVNRILKRRKEGVQAEPTSFSEAQQPPHHEQQGGQPVYRQPQVSTKEEHIDPMKQKTYEQYTDYAQYNPYCYQFSASHIPYNLPLFNKVKVPLALFASPVNQDLEYAQQSGSDIPRCTSCRAYMNYYNTANNKGFRCFLCGRQNTYQIDYSPDSAGVELQQPSYLVDGPQGLYPGIPPESAFIFVVDVSKEAWQCKMLSYIVAVLKDVLSREDLNETQIFFYTYDETVHEYDFTGEQAERTILDPSIKKNVDKVNGSFLSDIRERLFEFLDCIEQIAEKNSKQGSHFFEVYDYVYESIRHTAGKMFIFQANEAIAGESFTNENFKPTNAPAEAQKVKSFAETRNKTFFNKFVQAMLADNVSMSMFIWGRGYKNIKVFSDTCKLTNSELLYYSKDSPQDLKKFYYELYHLVGANYYVDTRIELIICAGWYLTAVYGNLYRLKQYISFKFCHYEPSKKLCAMFLPQQGQWAPSPAFSLQIVTNYIRGRKHYLSVNTAVLPFTSKIDRLFEGLNLQVTQAALVKGYLSSIRLEEITQVRNKYMRQCASIWKAFWDYYKGQLPAQARNMFLGLLGFLKHHHSQVDLINGTLPMERVIANRNLLQSCNYIQATNTFSPYLFSLAMEEDRCQDQNFTYPDVCDLRFSSVKEGLFLMDAGTVLYLYISKNCHPNYIYSLFGKEKLGKHEQLSEQVIGEQDNHFSRQVGTLVRVIRESRTYGWVPLLVVRCGQGSLSEKNFYCNFFEEKYDQFRSYKINFQEFTNTLRQTI